MREQFTFYRSYWEAIKRLKKPSDRLSAFEAITAYALDEVELPRSDSADAIFCLIKPLLDSAAKKAKGGRTTTREAEDSGKIAGRCEEDSGKIKAREREQYKEQEKEQEEVKEQMLYKRTRTRFVPPTLEEVAAYCQERNSSVDPKQFYEFFATGEWKDSKGNPVKNWKQKLLTWEKYDTPATKQAREKTFADLYREMGDEC